MSFTLLSNSPVSGQIAWSNVHIVYDGVEYAVADGTTHKRFVYWLLSSPNVFLASDDMPALSADDTIVFLNKGGVAINVLNASALEGDLVVPGTVTSSAIATDAIDSSHIKSNAIVGRHILAGEITADKITVESLRAISANMGDITSGSLTIDQTGFVRGGASSYGTGTGFWMGYHSGKYKLRAGTPGSSGFEWDGSAFNVYGPDGNLTISSGVVDWEKVGGSNKPESGATRNVFRGDWTASTDYIPGDIATKDGNGWSCLVAHTSAAGVNAPPSSGTGNTWWAIYATAGKSGKDGITVVIPNDTHALPANGVGAVASYVGSGTTIQVFEGDTALSAVSSITASGQFTVGTPTQSPSSVITIGARTYSGATATIAAHSALRDSVDVVTITYPISVRRADGSNLSLSAQQTLTKSKAGFNFSEAKMLRTDPTFQSSSNGATIYDNGGQGFTVVSRVAAQPDSPYKDSAYNLKISNTGPASPGLGGFVQLITARANAVFVQRIVAKIPVGYRIEQASNSLGTGGSSAWVTSKEGTGKFEEYILVRRCGADGTFSTSGHVYITAGAYGTPEVPVEWYVAYATVFDFTAIGFATVTATLSNETHAIPTDSAGNNGNYSGASTTMTLFNGTDNDSANWTVAAAPFNVEGSLSGKTYTVTNLLADTGYVDLTASRSGYASITKRFALTKSKAGQDGQDGEDGVSYNVEVESTNGNVFRPGQSSTTTLIAHVFRNGVEITDDLPASGFRWRRVSYQNPEPPNDDASWNALYAAGYKQIVVTTDSVQNRATYHCDIFV